MRRPVSLPPELIEQARAFASGERTPVAPRDAATVLLLRPEESGHGFEVFVMVRRRSMAFAAGAAVFPGGKVEPGDTAEVDADAWGERMGIPGAEASAVIGAAVRELEEETGVRLPASELGLWDGWTTPIFEPRRYRTWFFTALLPEGQQALEMSTESSSVEWVTPEEALRRAEAGEWRMLPPTYFSCLRLASFATIEDVLAAGSQHRVEMFTPALEGETLTRPSWVTELLA